MLGRKASRTLRIKPSYSVVVHDPDTVELRSGVWNPESYTLTDRSGGGRLATLLHGLDGSLDRAELAKLAGVTRAELEALIDHLQQLGVLESGASTALDALIAQTAPGTWAGVEAGTRAGGAAGNGAGGEPVLSTVRLLGDGSILDVVGRALAEDSRFTVHATVEQDELLARVDDCSVDSLEDGLAYERFVEAFEMWRGSYLVYAAEAVRPLRLAVLNRIALSLGTPWTHASVDGPLLMIGPTFVPGSSACFTCFETRIVMNLREAASYQRYKDALARADQHSGPRRSVAAAVSSLVAGHLAVETVNLAATGQCTTVGKVLGVYLPTMEVAYSEVLRLPGCTSCGSIPERDGGELYFDARRWLDA